MYLTRFNNDMRTIGTWLLYNVTCDSSEEESLFDCHNNGWKDISPLCDDYTQQAVALFCYGKGKLISIIIHSANNYLIIIIYFFKLLFIYLFVCVCGGGGYRGITLSVPLFISSTPL